jgi:hypothetical protein
MAKEQDQPSANNPGSGPKFTPAPKLPTPQWQSTDRAKVESTGTKQSK